MQGTYSDALIPCCRGHIAAKNIVLLSSNQINYGISPGIVEGVLAEEERMLEFIPTGILLIRNNI